MANLKNITDVPVVESAEGLNLIVNDNGAAKQIAASAVGAQADFAVTDETNPAFIKNKPDLSNVGGCVIIDLDNYGMGLMDMPSATPGKATIQTFSGTEIFNVCESAFNSNKQIKFSSSIMEEGKILFDASTIGCNGPTIFQITASFKVVFGIEMVIDCDLHILKNFDDDNSTTILVVCKEFSNIPLEPDEPSEPT